MNDCSRHKKEVAGISDMKILAEMIGDLHYKTLYIFLHELSEKLAIDELEDFMNGKELLSDQLALASARIHDAAFQIKQAWQISKPFMNEKT